MDNTALDINLDGIPEALAERDQWVLWRYEQRDGRATKVPKQPGGTNASSDDEATWSDLATVLEAYRTGQYEGIGFVLTDEDWFVFIDLDDCVEDGELTEPAQNICDGFDTYAEWSPSDTGAHIIGAGMKPGTDCKALNVPGMEEIEIYETGRYMTMTGQRINGHPTVIKPCREAIINVYEWAFEDDDSTSSEPTTTPDRDLSDTEIWDLVEQADDQKMLDLWQGDLTVKGGDHSRCDLSFCCKLRWYGADRQQIDSLLRDSGLMRPKWDEMRGDETYGEKTIDKALNLVDDVHPAVSDEPISGDGATGQPPDFVPPPSEELRDSDEEEEEVRWEDLDVQTANEIVSSGLEPLRPIVQHNGRTILPEGVSILASKPKLGKTMLGMNVSVGVAKGGTVFANATVNDAHQGDVLYINADGSKRGAKQRLTTMCPEADGGAPENLHMVHGPFPEGEDAQMLLRTWCEERPNTSLIVIDTLQHLRPSGNGRRSQYHSDYDFLFPIAEIGRQYNVSMLLIHHLNKLQKGDELDKVSGSTGLTGAAENILLLDRARGEDHAQLAVRPREEPEDEFKMKLDRRLLTWQVGLEQGPEPGTPEREEIWNVIVEAGEPMGLGSIADVVDKDTSTVSHHLNNLKTKDGMPVQRTNTGTYKAAGGEL
jgi:hypothetical protein